MIKLGKGNDVDYKEYKVVKANKNSEMNTVLNALCSGIKVISFFTLSPTNMLTKRKWISLRMTSI